MTKLKEEPKSWSGTSRDTGLFGSKITIGSVVVLGFGVEEALLGNTAEDVLPDYKYKSYH